MKSYLNKGANPENLDLSCFLNGQIRLKNVLKIIPYFASTNLDQGETE